MLVDGMPIEDYVGRAEIRDMLGLSRQRVHQLTEKKDFPDPVGELDGRPVWKKGDVEAWAKKSGRLP